MDRQGPIFKLFARQRGSMKKIVKSSPLCILPASLLALGMFLSLARFVQAQNQDVLVIEITARKYEYSISPVHVRLGTKVQLKITATDHDHVSKSQMSPMVPNRTVSVA